MLNRRLGRKSETERSTFPDVSAYVKPFPDTPSEQGLHKWMISKLPEQTEESSCSLQLKKYRRLMHATFTSGETKGFPLFIAASESKIPVPREMRANGNKSTQKCSTVCFCETVFSLKKMEKRMNSLFPSLQTLIITISWSQPRHLQPVECLLHILLSEMPPHYRILAKVK